MSSLTYENGVLLVKTPYQAVFVAGLKAKLPAADRQWDGARRGWQRPPAVSRQQPNV